MNISFRKILYISLPILAIAALVVIILLADQGELPTFLTMLYAFPYGDKVGHFLLMGVIGFILTLTLPLHWKVRGLLAFMIALILEEISQQFFPSRSFSLADLIFSLSGAAFFGCLGIRLSRRHVMKDKLDSPG